jgi:hypothetical protein
MARSLSLILGALLGCAAIAAGCGDDDSGGEGGEGLLFTRPDGSTFSIEDAVVQCRATRTQEQGAGQAIIAYGPPDILEDAGEDAISEPGFSLEAVLDDVSKPGTTVRFPDEVYSDGAGVSLFALDPDGLKELGPELPGPEIEDGGEPNELSSAEEEAGGEIVFERAGCSPPEVEFTVDARLGSEFFEQPSVAVEGSLRASGPP